VLSHGQSQRLQFPMCEFSTLARLVLTANKAMVRFCCGIKCHIQHYFLLAVKSVSFSHHINCFPGCIFMDKCHVSCYTAILQATAHAQRHQCTVRISACFDYMTVPAITDSLKSEDCDITNNLPKMPLSTTKVPQMQLQIFYFHTGKI
jgi:hypothetical protein